MNELTVAKLNKVNQDFYDSIAQYFDNSRQYSWDGWESIIGPQSAATLNKVLDVGCGNGRFYEFLRQKGYTGEYLGIDSNSFLLKQAQQKGTGPHTKFIQADLLGNWTAEGTYDLIVVFGVMHHIPSYAKRIELIKKLEQSLALTGMLVLSFWNFMDDERIAKKIVAWSEIGLNPDEVEENDYLISWDRGARALRFCHYFSEQEIREYSRRVSMKEIASFNAEGKDKNLNTYLMLQKCV